MNSRRDKPRAADLDTQKQSVLRAWSDKCLQFVALLEATESNITIQLGPDEDIVYLQGRLDDNGLVLEAVSNNFLPDHTKLTIADQCVLIELGWTPPSGEEFPNFHRYYEGPVDFADVAIDIITTFACAYHASPDSDFYVSPASLTASLGVVETPTAPHGSNLDVLPEVAVWLHGGYLVGLAMPADDRVYWAVSAEAESSLGSALAEAAGNLAGSNRSGDGCTTVPEFDELLTRVIIQPNFVTNGSLFALVGDLEDDLLLTLASAVATFGGPFGDVVVADSTGSRTSVSPLMVDAAPYEAIVRESSGADIDAAWIWFLAQCFERQPDLTNLVRHHPHTAVRAVAGWE